MRYLRWFGILLLVVGAASLGGSLYIMGQVNEGNAQIKKAEKMVDQGNSLFSLSPATKQLGKGITQSAEKKINMGKEQIAYYTALAGQLKMAGIILLIIGGVLTLLRCPRKH